jgi:hypothetical protein
MNCRKINIKLCNYCYNCVGSTCWTKYYLQYFERIKNDREKLKDKIIEWKDDERNSYYIKNVIINFFPQYIYLLNVIELLK